MIVGLGTDVVAVERIRGAWTRHGQRFLDRVYTGDEARHCLAAADPAERLAARWAAKEACMKALGTGWAKGVRFDHIALLPGGDGPPRLVLSGEARAAAERLGAVRTWCSISHDAGVAVATVILESA